MSLRRSSQQQQSPVANRRTSISTYSQQGRRPSQLEEKPSKAAKDMGTQEAEEYTDKMTKLNFDLKLKVFFLSEQINALIAQVQTLEAEKTELQESNEKMSSELETDDLKTQRIEAVKTKLEEANEKIYFLNEQNEALDDKVQKLEEIKTELEEANEKVHVLNEQNDILDTKMQKLNVEKRKLEKSNEKAFSELETLNTAVQNFSTKNSQLQSANENLSSDLEAINFKLQKILAEEIQLQSANEKILSELETLTAKLSAELEKNDQKTQELNSMISVVEEANVMIGLVEEKIEKLKSSGSSSSEIKVSPLRPKVSKISAGEGASTKSIHLSSSFHQENNNTNGALRRSVHLSNLKESMANLSAVSLVSVSNLHSNNDKESAVNNRERDLKSPAFIESSVASSPSGHGHTLQLLPTLKRKLSRKPRFSYNLQINHPITITGNTGKPQQQQPIDQEESSTEEKRLDCNYKESAIKVIDCINNGSTPPLPPISPLARNPKPSLKASTPTPQITYPPSPTPTPTPTPTPRTTLTPSDQNLLPHVPRTLPKEPHNHNRTPSPTLAGSIFTNHPLPPPHSPRRLYPPIPKKPNPNKQVGGSNLKPTMQRATAVTGDGTGSRARGLAKSRSLVSREREGDSGA